MNAIFQASGRKGEEEDRRGQFRGHRAKGFQSPRIGVFHFRAVLGAFFHPEHSICRLPALRRARTRGGGVSMARIRQFDY